MRIRLHDKPAAAAKSLWKSRSIRWLITAVLLLSAGLTISGAAAWPANGPPVLEAVLLYNNPCESCHIDEQVYRQLGEALEALPAAVRLNYTAYRADLKQGRELLDAWTTRGLIADKNRNAGLILMIGRQVLLNDQISVSGLRTTVARLLQEEPAAMRIPAGTAGAITAGLSDSPETPPVPVLTLSPSAGPRIILIRTEGCAGCVSAGNWLASQYRIVLADDAVPDVSDSRPQVQVQEYSLARPADYALVNRLLDAYQVPDRDRQVPMVLAGTNAISGYAAIQARLPGLISQGSANYQIELTSAAEPGLDRYQGFGIWAAGFLNGFNPCSLSMLLLFLSLLLAKKKAFLAGAVGYMTGKTAASMILGTIAYQLLLQLQDSWLISVSRALRIILSVVLLVLALAYIFDFIAARQERYDRIHMQLPVKLRQLNQQWIARTMKRRTAGLAAVCLLLGFGITAGEFLCTGQIYLASILYVLHETGRKSEAILSLALYTAGLITPPVFVTLLVYRGKSIFILSERIRERLSWIKLASAAFFGTFAVYVALAG
ncbi:MAG: hypothetical protein VB070_11375 [Clostridiaceae bacterium]|nr:hypothetical protein [Clostridiaceae bacterium]